MTATCFVVMGFGKKTDFETGRTLDLDKSYKNLIKPAVEAAGLACIRADEIVHSGLIDVPMYQQLLSADVVVADLSTSNKNAFYELGIRHALRPFTTIVVSEEGLKVPFDVNHVVVRSYKHLGEDIGFDETMRFRGMLKEAIEKILAQSEADRVDSPVYRFVRGLVPPSAIAAAAAAAVRAGPDADASSNETHGALMKQVNEAIARKDFRSARDLLKVVQSLMKHDGDAFIVQRLALVTYKSKDPDELSALRAAAALLAPLEPETSNDTETLGLWGAVHKRLWSLTNDRAHLDQAVRALERGFYLRNDYYNGINLAFLLNVRASCTTRADDAVADFVLARRVREEVLAICNRWLGEHPQPPDTAAAPAEDVNNRYWALATKGEAEVGLGDEAIPQALAEAYRIAKESWMVDSTQQQITQLRALLVDSPLRFLRTLSTAAGNG